VTGDPSKDICEALMGELVKLDLKSQVVSPVHLVFEAKGST